jgi:hypothetical protein
VTDRLLIFGERHLRQLLAEYAAYYNARRPHRAAPASTAPGVTCPRAGCGTVLRRPVLGGLINEYEPAA